jgi:hypothetical protein
LLAPSRTDDLVSVDPSRSSVTLSKPPPVTSTRMYVGRSLSRWTVSAILGAAFIIPMVAVPVLRGEEGEHDGRARRRAPQVSNRPSQLAEMMPSRIAARPSTEEAMRLDANTPTAIVEERAAARVGDALAESREPIERSSERPRERANDRSTERLEGSPKQRAPMPEGTHLSLAWEPSVVADEPADPAPPLDGEPKEQDTETNPYIYK